MRRIVDYIAGMTERYALVEPREAFSGFVATSVQQPVHSHLSGVPAPSGLCCIVAGKARRAGKNVHLFRKIDPQVFDFQRGIVEKRPLSSGTQRIAVMYVLVTRLERSLAAGMVLIHRRFQMSGGKPTR
jgi:hypothetical protein